MSETHHQETYRPVPRMVIYPAIRRTVSPGVFEFARFTDTAAARPPIRCLNALQPVEDCEKLLKQNDKTGNIQTKHGVVSHSSSYVSAYAGRGEDRMAVDAISYEALAQAMKEGTDKGRTWWGQWGDLKKAEGDKDLLFFTVIDGHGGAQVCDLLEVAANACIGWAIGNSPEAMAGDETAMVKALNDAIVTINQDIAAAAPGIMKDPTTVPVGAQLPGMPSIAQLFQSHLERSGACIATAVVDLVRGKLYVASAGDCRIVGVWTDGEGSWRSEALTEDHGGFNPKEVARVKAEHPNDPNAMIDTGDGWHKLLGHHQPTHVIGDVAKNRNQAERAELLAQAYAENTWPIEYPGNDIPYVSWTPEIMVRPISKDGWKLKKIILGTDGLAEKITSEELALLTIAHNFHPEGDVIAKTELPKLIRFDPPPEPRPFPVEPLPGSEGEMAEGVWLFDDESPATHLVRNALCHGDRVLSRQMLSLREGTRMFRDDTLALVVDFDL